MKVLYHTDLPFSLAHGGVQTLVENLMQNMDAAGVQVEPLRWWDASQRGDIMHYFGRPTHHRLTLAHQKGYRVVFTDLLDRTASRPRPLLWAQRCAIAILRQVLPPVSQRLAWDTYRQADAIIYLVGHEVDVSRQLFGTNTDRAHIIPLGIDLAAIQSLAQPEKEGPHLVCMGTIHPRKNPLLLARAAHLASVPIVFIGKPYSETDSYFEQFMKEVDNGLVKYAGFVEESEKRSILRTARGFTLLSEQESGCIAVHEAAAAGLPLMLSKLPWAERSYPNAKITFQKLGDPECVAPGLRDFYTTAHRLPDQTFPVISWQDVAKLHADLYVQLMNRPITT